MAIQFRRGAYANFDPDNMVPGEIAFVLSGDPNTTTGKAVYACFTAGTAVLLGTATDFIPMPLSPTEGDVLVYHNGAWVAGEAQSGGSGLTDDIKEALLACFEHVAWIDDDGQDYYDALETALNDTTWSVTNTLSHCTSSNAAVSVTKNASYSATITASAGYTLTGATVSVTMGGTNITSTAYNNGVISIASVTGNLSISVSAVESVAELVSIDAVYTQSGTVYASDTLDSLKPDLVVTATYDDTSTSIVPSTDYTLSGTLTTGTSTITVTYQGKTDTFTVTVTYAPVYTKNYTTDGTFVGSGIYANARSAAENPNIKQDIYAISNVQSGDVINLIVGWNESTYTSNKARFISTASNTTPSMTDGTFVKHGTSYGEQPVTVNSDYDVLYVSVQNTNSSYAQYATWTRESGF